MVSPMNQDDSQHWRNRFAPEQPAATETVATVVLVQGEGQQGEAQWAYALIPSDRFMAFRMAEQAGAYNLADFGTIVCSGTGAEPPQDVRERMAEEYGCNPDFESQMEEALAEAIADLPENRG